MCQVMEDERISHMCKCVLLKFQRAEALDDVIEGSEGGLSMEHNEDDEELEDHDHEGDTEHEMNDEHEEHETNEDVLDDDNKEVGHLRLNPCFLKIEGNFLITAPPFFTPLPFQSLLPLRSFLFLCFDSGN